MGYRVQTISVNSTRNIRSKGGSRYVEQNVRGDMAGYTNNENRVQEGEREVREVREG